MATEVKTFDDAYREDYKSKTGHLTNTMYTGVKRSVSQFLNKNGATKFVIGLATNGQEGCKELWENTFQTETYKQMIPLYKTNSTLYGNELVKNLVEDFKEGYGNSKMDDIKVGSISKSESPFIVYLCWK
ncbi:hypothetical protein ABK040_003910 [Willaertia magna]